MTQQIDEPREPLREVVATPQALAACLDSLTQGDGPVAFDAERAHGYRYWPKAYLFQIRRQGAGTWLIDPLPFEDPDDPPLKELITATEGSPWLIHAASQDLPCMLEHQIIPKELFDTELAARLAGEPVAGLGPLLELKLGLGLRKAHSAANWATRPLPSDWLTYAALDVDYLAELAVCLQQTLTELRRQEWAAQEFAETLRSFSVPRPPRPEPWRRLSGITNLRNRRQLALARALWEERDQIARRRDRPPGKILPDAAIVELAGLLKSDSNWPSPRTLSSIRAFNSRGAQRYRNNWLAVIEQVSQLGPGQYPQRRGIQVGTPPPRSWDRINPEAAARWALVKPLVDELACEIGIQASLVAPPAIVQTVVFEFNPGQEIASALATQGARPWQREFLVPLLESVL